MVTSVCFKEQTFANNDDVSIVYFNYQDNLGVRLLHLFRKTM